MNYAKKKKRYVLNLTGVPNEKQRQFFASHTRYTAYGGARGGGKSWALRRKLILMCLRYKNLRCLIIRRSFPELRENHILPLLSELREVTKYTDSRKCFEFPNGSRISLGFCSAESDVLQYQGQEYDVIAIDEATQLTEYQFNTLKACVRGVSKSPKRMYLTCNPGGIGHSWVKRLFIDRCFNEHENPYDYSFIQAKVFDNNVLIDSCPDYVNQLKSLPYQLRMAWLDGRWDIFEGQYFTEFSIQKHTVTPFEIPYNYTRFCALDYGFDMLAAIWLAVDFDGRCYVYREVLMPNLTLSEAANIVATHCLGENIEYIAASPDLWNRRQDTGYSGVEIMSRTPALPPLIKADNRRVIGWRCLREYLKETDGKVQLQIFSTCTELIRCLPLLVFDKTQPEDAASEPHAITHAPEALRYALMSRLSSPKLPSSDDFSEFLIKRKRQKGIADY